LIVSRIKNDLEEARKRGIRLGTEPKYPKYRKRVLEMGASGMDWREICMNLNINYRTARKCIA